MRHYGNKVQSKLEKLEQLKYEATSNELKKNSKRKEIEVDVRLMPSIDMSEITDDGGRLNITSTLKKFYFMSNVICFLGLNITIASWY